MPLLCDLIYVSGMFIKSALSNKPPKRRVIVKLVWGKHFLSLYVHIILELAQMLFVSTANMLGMVLIQSPC